MNKNSTDPHRVWIELEYPEGGNCKDGDIRAARASAMLMRLGHHMENVFWWNSRIKKYCVTIDEGGGFLELNDNGHWFNLDFLATGERSSPPKVAA